MRGHLKAILLNANPYSFLDDAPVEERRARAVSVRRTLSIEEMGNLARLDPEAIDRVRAEAAPVVRDAEELHDTLLVLGALPAREGKEWKVFFDELVAQNRATAITSFPAATGGESPNCSWRSSASDRGG